MDDRFNTVVFRKATPKTAPKTAFSVAQERAKGNVVTQKKVSPPKSSINARKLDEETEDFRHAKLDTNFKLALMQARQAKGLTQAQIAGLINVKPNIINDYEQGKVVPDQAIISKLNRALSTKLPKMVKPKKDKSNN